MRAGALALAIGFASAPTASANILVVDLDAFGGGGGVIRVDPLTGARTTVSENASPAGGPAFVEPLAITIAANGDILVADQQAFADTGGGVIRVDPVTGARTTVSENASPAGGPSFVDPFGITLAANGDILVADQNFGGPGNGGVIRVDPVTGARTLVSENNSPTGGPSFDAPFGIDTASNGDILVADAGAFGGGGGVIRVNPVTGVRTTVSENQAPPGTPNFSDPFGLVVAPNGDLLSATQFRRRHPGQLDQRRPQRPVRQLDPGRGAGLRQSDRARTRGRRRHPGRGRGLSGGGGVIRRQPADRRPNAGLGQRDPVGRACLRRPVRDRG